MSPAAHCNTNAAPPPTTGQACVRVKKKAQVTGQRSSSSAAARCRSLTIENVSPQSGSDRALAAAAVGSGGGSHTAGAERSNAPAGSGGTAVSHGVTSRSDCCGCALEIDPPKRVGLRTNPSICGFVSLFRKNNFTSERTIWLRRQCFFWGGGVNPTHIRRRRASLHNDECFSHDCRRIHCREMIERRADPPEDRLLTTTSNCRMHCREAPPGRTTRRSAAAATAARASAPSARGDNGTVFFTGCPR